MIGSGHVIIRGNGSTTAAPVFTGAAASGPQINTFSGVVYALNLQRHAVADGGLGLGDVATVRHEVVRIDSGAHVKGAVYADGKSAMVSIIPPALTLDTTALVDALFPCEGILTPVNCIANAAVKLLSGVTAIVDNSSRASACPP